MSKVLVSGYYGFGNPGDEAILQVLKEDFAYALGDVDIVVLSGDPDSTRTTHGVEAIRVDDWERIFDVIRESSLIVVGGGGLIQDYWGPKLEDTLSGRQFDLSRIASLGTLASLAGVPFVLYGVGVGPLLTAEGEELTRAILDSASLVVVRDQASASYAETFLADRKDSRVVLGSDLAVRLPGLAGQAAQTVLGSGLAGVEGRLAVNLRYWDFDIDPRSFIPIVAEGLMLWLDTSGGRIELVPFQSNPGSRFEDDPAVLEILLSAFKDQSNVVLRQPSTWQESIDFMIRPDLFLAMRYHSALLPLMAGKSGVIISYDPKCEAMASELGLANSCQRAQVVTPEWIYTQLTNADNRGLAERRQVSENLTLLRRRGLVARDQFAARWAAGLEVRSLPDAIGSLLFDRVTQLLTVRARATKGRSLNDLMWLNDGQMTQTSAQRGREAQLDDEIQELKRQLGAARRESEEKAQRVREIQLEHDQLASHVSELTAEVELAKEKSQLDRDSADQIRSLYSQQQIADARIRSTFGYRLLSWYWRFAKGLLPAGSRRRWVYARSVLIAKRLFRRVLPHQDPTRFRMSGGSPVQTQSDAWERELLASFYEFAVGGWREGDNRLLILSPIDPLREPGQRAAALARELAHKGSPAVIAYWRWSRDEMPIPNQREDSLFFVPLDVLLGQKAPMLDALRSERSTVLIEFPHPSFFGLLSLANGAGWITIYDVIDHWAAFHEAGQAPWYDPSFEEYLLGAADLVLATSPSLISRVQRISGGDAIHLPNAASRDVMLANGTGSNVGDGTTIGYFGSLADAWFDWDLVKAVALSRPEWRFELVGPLDQDNGHDMPANVNLMGTVSQIQLGQVAVNWDAAIAPFREGPLAEAVDAIKVYEYLRLGLPVVMTGASPPLGADRHVSRVSGPSEFVHALEDRVTHRSVGMDDRLNFGRANTWRDRAAALSSLLDSPPRRVQEKLALFSRS